MDETTIIEKLSEQVVTIALLDQPLTQAELNEDLLASGVLDSYGYIELITFMESEFDIEISEDDQFDERLRTIAGAASFLMENV